MFERGGMSEWLEINVGVRQGCVMLPRLFNVFFFFFFFMNGVLHVVVLPWPTIIKENGSYHSYCMLMMLCCQLNQRMSWGE